MQSKSPWVTRSKKKNETGERTIKNFTFTRMQFQTRGAFFLGGRLYMDATLLNKVTTFSPCQTQGLAHRIQVLLCFGTSIASYLISVSLKPGWWYIKEHIQNFCIQLKIPNAIPLMRAWNSLCLTVPLWRSIFKVMRSTKRNLWLSYKPRTE